MQFFHHFLNIFFWLLDPRLDLVEFFKCMSWQLIFFSFFDLSTSGNDAYHRWPSKLKHLFSVWGLFWKVGLLVQSCLYHFCPNRGLWLKSVLEKWVFFGQHTLRHQSGWFQNITILGTCIFGSWKGFGRLEAIASLDAYQITNCQFLSKVHHFCCLISKNSREVSKSRILWPNAWASVI